MPFVDSYTFSHRFTGETTFDTAGYQEIIYQCQDVNVMSLTRAFFHFAMACGYAPTNIVDAFNCMADEYGQSYCYDGKNND